MAIAAAMTASSEGSKANRQRGNEYLQQLARTMPQDKFQRLQAAAQARLQTMSDDARQGLRAMMDVSGSTGGIEANIQRASQLFGARELKAAQTGLLNQIRDVSDSPDAVSGDNIEATINQMSPEALDRLEKRNKPLADALREHQAGKKGALEKAISIAAPTGTKEVYGGGSGGEMDKIDEQISQIEKMRDQLAPGDAGAQIQAASSELMAGAAKDLKEAAASLKNAADNATIAGSHPVLQAILGGVGVGR